MRNLAALILIFFSFIPRAQQGDFLLTEHLPRLSNLDNSNFEIINDLKGRICIANRSGVIKYDGEAWDFYKTPSAALSLAVDSANIVYVGGIGSVGKIDFSEGKIQFQTLAQQDTLDDLFLETLYLNGRVYFVGNKMLLIYHTIDQSVTQFEGEFINAYALDQEVFVNAADNHTYLVSDSLQQISAKKKVASTHQKAGNPELVLDFNGKLFLYEDFNSEELPQNKIIAERGYEIQEVRWINESLFVCSTFESGLLFFDKDQPEYIKVSDYHAGLADNEIFALHTDDFSGVWAAHEFGITQISPLFPAFSYAHFPGLNGNLISTSFYKDELWVTTSLGLFYFDRDTVFETKVYYETVSTQKKKTTKTTKKKETTPKASDQKISLKRLFGKKNRAKQQNEEKGKEEKDEIKEEMKSEESKGKQYLTN